MKTPLKLTMLLALAGCGQATTSTIDTTPSAEPMGGLRTEAVPGTACDAGGWVVASTGGCLYGSVYGVSPSSCGPSETSECWTFNTAGFGQFSSLLINARTSYGMGSSFLIKGGGSDDYQLTDYNGGGVGTQNGPELPIQWWAGAIGFDTQNRGNPQSCLVSPRDENNFFFATADSNDGCSVAENNAYANQAMFFGIGFKAAIATSDFAQPGWHTTYLDWPANGHCNTTGLTPATVTQASTTVLNTLEQPQGGQVLTFSMPGMGQPGYPAAGFTIGTAGCQGALLTTDTNGTVSWGPPNQAHQYLVVRDTTSTQTVANLKDVTTGQCTTWNGVGVAPTSTGCVGGTYSQQAYPTYSNP